MKNIFSILIILAFTFNYCDQKKEVHSKKIFIDEIGNKIELPKTPERIISTAPNLTEMIFEIGAGDLLVGRTSYCNYPPEVNKIEIIGDMLHLNFEKIVELKPDLIFMTVEGNTKEIYDKLKSLGIEIYVANPRSLSDIMLTMRNMGIILNRKGRADSVLNLLERNLKGISAQNIKRQKTIFVISLSPLIIAGKNTFINEILEKAYLENISPRNSISAYPIISREEVLDENPDVIILPSRQYTLESILKVYPEWRKLNAIKNKKVIYVDQDLFFRPGPRFIDAINFLIKELNKWSN